MARRDRPYKTALFAVPFSSGASAQDSSSSLDHATGTLYMLEVCCGSGASSRAMITYMRRIGREGKSLLIDIMTLEVLLSTYPELIPYLEDGSVVYFEACLTQMRQGDLQLLVEGLLGIPWARLHSSHVSLACTTWSWACLSKKRYRTLEGAAIDYEA